ncbi:MAG: ester cyclase [Chitinophagaceae bacterium]
MKKLLVAAAITLLCNSVACTDAGNNTSEEGKMNASEENMNTSQNEKIKANTREVYRAAETGDVSKLDSFISKDFIDHSGRGGREVRGLDSLKADIGDMHKHFKDLKMDIIAQANDNDYSFDMVKLTGTIIDDSWGIPANTRIESKSVNVVRLKDGMAVEHWRFEQVKEMPSMLKKKK